MKAKPFDPKQDIKAPPKSSSNSASYCPICHKLNQCAMITPGKNINQCWCTRKTIPQELIDQLPEKEIGARCICQDCVDTYNQNTKNRD